MISEETKQALTSRALEVARGIMDGSINPNIGCSELGDICHVLDYPSNLTAFNLLAHEQHDHESIGITAESCVPDILKECENLLSSSA